jgi:hypothetical protein
MMAKSCVLQLHAHSAAKSELQLLLQMLMVLLSCCQGPSALRLPPDTTLHTRNVLFSRLAGLKLQGKAFEIRGRSGQIDERERERFPCLFCGCCFCLGGCE